MMRRLLPERIPLALSAAFIAACSVITAWNLTVAAAFPRLVIRNWNQLYGLIEETPASFSVASFVRGEDQTNFSRRLGAALPIYAPAVRIRNQIEFSVVIHVHGFNAPDGFRKWKRVAHPDDWGCVARVAWQRPESTNDKSRGGQRQRIGNDVFRLCPHCDGLSNVAPAKSSL